MLLELPSAHPPCQDRAVLRFAEVTATLVLPDSPFHNVHWRLSLEFTLDCFICERTDRTTQFEYGAERAICPGDSRTPRHYIAGQVASFDYTSEKERSALHV